MGQTNVFDLPWPELPDLADGPDGFESLATATEIALLSMLNQEPAERVIYASGKQQLFHATWGRAAWAGADYMNPPSGAGFDLGPSGVRPLTSGRYEIDFSCVFPAGMPAGRRAIGIDLVSATQPDQTRMRSWWYGGTTGINVERIVVTMSLTSAVSGGLVTGWMWQESNTTVNMDRSKFAMSIRRLRPGQLV